MSTANEQRTLAVSLMKSREKKNSYTQGSKRSYFFGHPNNQVGNTTQNGYSDCSSSVRACIKAASGVDIGSNTSAQINNRNKIGLVVHTTDGYYPDESKLLPGDCLYFKGNTSHPLDVGHVEMYTGDNECYGHGSGTGPTKKNLKEYCKSRASSKKRYFMAIRWIPDGDSSEDLAGSISNGITVTNGSWNVRIGPGSNYESVGTVRKGSVLEKVNIGDWIPVIYNDKLRYISSKAVK